MICDAIRMTDQIAQWWKGLAKELETDIESYDAMNS